MKIRGIAAAFVVALAVVLMAGLAQGGADLLRADRAAATDTQRTSTDTQRADAGNGTEIELRTVSFNMCGGLCNKGGTGKLPLIVDEISEFTPHLVLLQEVCWPQYEWFKNTYAGTYDFGYTPLLTNYTGCGASDCSVNMDSDPANDDKRCWIGQVVGARGVLGSKDEIPLGGERYQIKQKDGGPVEPVSPARTFNALCYDATLDGVSRKVKGCSVHLRAFADDKLVNERARVAQAANLASALDQDIAAGKVVVVGGDFNTLPQPGKTPALDSFYRASAAPGGGIGRFYEADHDDTAYWEKPTPLCAVGTDTSCRTGESTIVNLSPLEGDKRNSKIDYIFFSETTAHATLSGDAIPMYLKDAAGTVITHVEAEAAKGTDGKYLKVSEHAFYRGLVTVTATSPVS
ncbi:endonuclease/exonuclease/phosphatase family protein [Streptomyces sp. NPDC015346]|uniref:endonuclease/exonuclease/phosphatase family protein n=1 Tax=Streptomyces sp. NPDC015346 TaxID=3364954 RepID=UPI0036FDF4A7